MPIVISVGGSSYPLTEEVARLLAERLTSNSGGQGPGWTLAIALDEAGKEGRQVHLPLSEEEHSALSDITAWAEHWNANPRPYVWTKTADEIIANLARYCKRISDSGH